MTWIIHNMFESINTIEILFEISLPRIIQEFYTWETNFMLTYFALTLLEIWTIKFWLKFIRKRMIVMNESFMVFSLTFINIMISTLWALGKLIMEDLVGWLPLHQSVFIAPSGRK